MRKTLHFCQSFQERSKKTNCNIGTTKHISYMMVVRVVVVVSVAKLVE